MSRSNKMKSYIVRYRIRLIDNVISAFKKKQDEYKKFMTFIYGVCDIIQINQFFFVFF